MRSLKKYFNVTLAAAVCWRHGCRSALILSRASHRIQKIAYPFNTRIALASLHNFMFTPMIQNPGIDQPVTRTTLYSEATSYLAVKLPKKSDCELACDAAKRGKARE
jgi:hypothetical protein